MTEAQVSTKFRLALASLGAVAWKMSDRFHASRPDLLVWWSGQAYAIETKIYPNKPTPLQALTLQELSKVGVCTYTATFNKLSKYLDVLDLKTGHSAQFKDIRSAAQWVLRLRY